MHRGKLAAIRWLLITLLATVVARGQEAKVVEKEGRVVVTKAGARPAPAVVGIALVARDRLGTGESSRAVLKMSAKWFARVDEETDIEITPGAFAASDKDALKVALGGAFIYSREEEGELKVQTPSATAGLRGTQLMVRVMPDEKTLIQVVEGEVDLENEFGRVLLAAGEAGEAERGRPPRKTAVIETRNLLQWALYYPAVLQPDEVDLPENDRRALAASLAAYRQGDLLGALDEFPRDFATASNGAKLYRAAVLLATGQVDRARAVIREVPGETPGRRALERLIAAVLMLEQPVAGATTTAGEALAESYYQQSRRQLEAARGAARRAAELAKDSGFAWTRLAELEFSFGRTREASAALERGLKLSPRNAQAHALRGYLQSAENRIEAARASFEEAVRLDGGLGNAWLGLGLTKIKQGEQADGLADLQTAVTVEPARSFFYSYHGKALSLAGQGGQARKDLELAKQFDPQDPTPWLYAALLTQQENRYNPAIQDLQESLRLNDNRRVYRSQFLLDQDRAVRSSNLAKLYQNNGMTDLAVREATRAVGGDYANASAHLFLANSFDALRDPTRVALRYETAWFNEQLLANLLAPVGGGPLSQFVSQQEYSKLLDADGLGGAITAERRDDGFTDVTASLSATYGRLSAGLDLTHHDDDGGRANSDNSSRAVYGQVKYQVSPYDQFYALGLWQKQDGGDLFQSYENLPGNPGLRFEEGQKPGLLLLGWNRRWAPGVHTLLLGGRLAADQTITAPATLQLLLERDPAFLQPGFLRPGTNGALEYTAPGLRNATVPPVATNPDGSLSVTAEFRSAIAPFLGRGPVTAWDRQLFDFATQRRFEIHSGEAQHIWQTNRNTLLLGGRWQRGEFETETLLDLLNPDLVPFFTSPASRQEVTVDFSRQGLYAYDFFVLTPALTLMAGVAWDRIERPENFRNPPVSDRQVESRKTSGKFGFTLSPSSALTIRGAYAETLGGVTFDESVRLEPVQFVGFNQAFRTVISESIAGSVEAPIYKNWGLNLEGRLPGRTWWSASANLLREDVERTVGAFDILPAPVFPDGLLVLPAGTSEKLSYREEVFSAGLNHLVGSEFAFGAAYRVNRARLHSRSTQIPVVILANADRRDEATLHELALNANWNAPSGWFARAEANGYSQELDARVGGLDASPPGDEFWQFNATVGFRFARHRREVSAGVLNLADRDYHLSPLNYLRELPRGRTFFVRCRLNF